MHGRVPQLQAIRGGILPRGNYSLEVGVHKVQQGADID
jgi:hypothetical protein